MTKGLSKFITIASVVAIVGAFTVVPAKADTFDLIPTRGQGCNVSVSISVQPIAAETYTMRASGGGNCPGTTTTEVEVCVLMQQANGDYEKAGGACGAGASTGRASSSAEVVCAAGIDYIATVMAFDENNLDKGKTGEVRCPPLSK